MKLDSKDFKSLAVALAIPQAIGGLGALATARSVNSWYRTIKKPSWNPPGKVFGPVWTLLYLLMGTASWLVWRADRREEDKRQALSLYGAQLGLNLLWSFIFFGFRRIGPAVGEIVALWTLILATLTRFYSLNPLAGLLLLPYQLWTTFAAVLNATVWRLNR